MSLASGDLGQCIFTIYVYLEIASVDVTDREREGAHTHRKNQGPPELGVPHQGPIPFSLSRLQALTPRGGCTSSRRRTPLTQRHASSDPLFSPLRVQVSFRS